MDAPYFYDYINNFTSHYHPSMNHIHNNHAAAFYRRYLLQKAISVFEFDLSSTQWDKNYFLYTLFCVGYLGVLNTNKYGIIAQHCSLRGHNIYYRPTHIMVQNPLLRGIREPEIGKTCEIIQIQPDFGGMMDIVQYYSGMMALCAQAIEMNLLNSKLSYVFTAENKAASETFKKLFDEIASGEPAVVTGKTLIDEEGRPRWQAFEQNVSGNYITDKLLIDMRKIEMMFDTDVGIPNANTDKKERMTIDEVNVNNSETRSKIMLWLETLQDSIKKVNDMFSLNITVKIREHIETDTPMEVDAIGKI